MISTWSEAFLFTAKRKILLHYICLNWLEVQWLFMVQCCKIHTRSILSPYCQFLKVIPLVALCIYFEWWRTVMCGEQYHRNALYRVGGIALLQIICNWDLLDMLYIHDFVYVWNEWWSTFSLEAGWFAGQLVVHYRHLLTDQTCFSLNGLVQYI